MYYHERCIFFVKNDDCNCVARVNSSCVFLVCVCVCIPTIWYTYDVHDMYYTLLRLLWESVWWRVRQGEVEKKSATFAPRQSSRRPCIFFFFFVFLTTMYYTTWSFLFFSLLFFCECKFCVAVKTLGLTIFFSLFFWDITSCTQWRSLVFWMIFCIGQGVRNSANKTDAQLTPVIQLFDCEQKGNKKMGFWTLNRVTQWSYFSRYYERDILIVQTTFGHYLEINPVYIRTGSDIIQFSNVAR